MAYSIGVSQVARVSIGVAQVSAVAPSVITLERGFPSGYNCFINQYVRALGLSVLPMKLPDGTLW